MINIPVFIEYETKNRELDGKLLLINYLLDAGFSKIYIGASDPLRNEALTYNNGIYFFKSTWKDEENLYKELKEKAFTLILMHAEGGIYNKDNKKSIELLYSKNLINYFDFNFNFGNNIKEDIEKLYGKNLNCKNVITGEPRFDLLKPKFHSFFQDNVNKILNKYDNFILINTNFSAGNHALGTDRYIELLKNDTNLTKETVDNYLKLIEYQSKVINEYVIAINNISNKFPNINFVIRAHPSESQVFYKKKFNKKKNIFVTKKGNVANWIIASKGVIHYDCTTGIEALIANKPVISYTPILDDKFVSWLPIQVSKQANNLDELFFQIQSIIDGKFQYNIEPSNKLLLENTINNLKADSSPIIVQNLLSSLNKNELYSSFTKTKNSTLFKLVYSLKEIVKYIIKYEKIKRINAAQKFGNTSTVEIRNKINHIKNKLGLQYKFHVIRHTTKSFIIERK
jgi:surface carbohydrate biosynthesis protein